MFEVISVAVLILSIVFHEVSHGYIANWLGDPTARLSGRLTMNPLVHIDPFGSIILPVSMYFFSGGMMLFGWAKPVPYNPYNLRNQRWGEALVAAAGPLSNIFLASIFGLLINLKTPLSLSTGFVDMALHIVQLNVVLALFNAIPIPPLDGSKVLGAVLPFRLARSYREMTISLERLGLAGTFLVLFLFWTFFMGPFSILVSAVTNGIVSGLGFFF